MAFSTPERPFFAPPEAAGCHRAKAGPTLAQKRLKKNRIFSLTACNVIIKQY